MIAPLTGQPSGPHRNAMTFAIASTGTAFTIADCGMFARFAGVSIRAGSTAFTRTRESLNCSASRPVSRTTALLDSEYAIGSVPVSADREPTLTIEPPAADRRGAAAWHDHSV